MAKVKFQCSCGKIIDGKTDNKMGASHSNVDIVCPTCLNVYNADVIIRLVG